MQYGNLTATQISMFNLARLCSIREPSFAVWIEGFTDSTEYVIEIDSEITIGFQYGKGLLNIGIAMLVMDNYDGYFYSNGISKIARNARIKIWAGFGGANIPIFTGTVKSVEPMGTTDIVLLNCRDYMGLFQEVFIHGNQYPNNTAELLIKKFCSLLHIPEPNIESTDETTNIFTQPTFEEVSLFTALEEVCSSIFYIAYFDEDGNLNAVEREHSISVDYLFDSSNIIDYENLVDTSVFNDVTIEYDEDFFCKYEDYISIDTYGKKSRNEQIFLLNSKLVSNIATGSKVEKLEHNLEAFKITSESDAVTIDCAHIKMKGDDAHGYITAGIYSDSNGAPDALLATSQLKASGNLAADFTWEIFHFEKPVSISSTTDYWMAIDIGSLSSGTIYLQVSGDDCIARYAYRDYGNWVKENNKQVLHKVRGSINAQRVAADIIEFHKTPYERIRITAPAVPHLQLLDKVTVNTGLRERQGHYVIEGRRHIITPDSYTTIDTLRKV